MMGKPIQKTSVENLLFHAHHWSEGMNRLLILAGRFLLCLPLVVASELESPKQDIIATFSIAAVDPETGQCGAAVASRFPAVGKVVAHARPGVGAYCTQHYDIRASAPKALD